MSWTIIIPVKRLTVAKSRLRGLPNGVALADADHHRLVLAMALDAAHAALSSPVVGRVAVVTSDPVAAPAAAGLGADIVADVPDAGLNPALAYAAQQVRPWGATSLPGVAALAADLPALRPDDLTDALRAAEALVDQTGAPADPSRGRRAFVSDASGTGTVLLAAPGGVRLEPCFGANSAAAHASSGAVELAGAWASLRRDVDTTSDLVEAMALGVGERTAEVVAAVLAGAGPLAASTPVPGG